MLKRFFSGAAKVQRPKPRVPDGTTVFAIGDIHGRFDLLTALLKQISHDISESEAADVIMVFLGDYIDRGPDSNRVIDKLIKLKHAAGNHLVALKGNHEDAMLTFLADGQSGPAWAEHGGRETMLSYGVEVPRRRTDTEAWDKARATLAENAPREHLNFLNTLSLSQSIGDYFFVHAGVRPGVPLLEQEERDLLWIREEFLADSRDLDKVVVHGHTPVDTPFSSSRRISIDTGAYATGVLTALKLQGEQQSFLQTGA